MIKRARTLFKHFSSTSVHHTELLKQTHTALQQAEEKRGHGLTRLWKKPKEKSWVLLIGKHGAGKTTLLEKSQYPLRSPFKKSIKNINETKNIDWWIGDDLVFIDPAGKYCFSTPLEQEHYQYWQNFLSILSQKYPHPFDSVSLIVDLPTLIYHQDISFDDFVRRWQEQIRLLENFCVPLCINIIVTQCDYLAGYAEFFVNLDSQQQQQVFGFSLMDSSQTTHVHDLFVQRFHDFIQIVNQRTLNRLHQEPNHERRLRIHDFPLQLEKLEKPLFALLNALSDSNTLFVNNVFFCNSAQTTHPIHLLNDDLNKTFQLKATNEAPLVAEERVFFTHDLIPELGKANIVKPILRKTTTNKWWHFSSYPLAIIVIIILTAIYHHSYRNNLSAINAIATSMTQPNGQLAWLSELNHLKQAEEATDRYKLGNYRIFGFNQGYELTQEIKRQYNWRLTHQFIPYLNESIVTKIKQDSDTNSPELYNSLMVYLMMGQQDERDDAFIKNWFHKLWKNQFTDDTKSQRNLNQYLYDVLRNPIVHWKKDKDLVQQSNEALQKQPLADIAYRMLRNNSRLDSLPLKNGMSIEGIDLSKASIPVFYSTNNFALIYKKEIPHLAEAIFKGKSILQNKHSTDLTLEKLIAQLQLMYVQRYLSNWNTSMQQIAFQQPKNFKQAAEQTNLITNPHSPLWQIYQHAIDAITRSSGEEDLKKAFAENNINLADYMPSADKAKNTAKALNQLQAYLQRINDAPSPVKAAYDAAAQRYNENDTKDVITNVLNTAKSLPNPLQHWTEEMARNDWKLMLDNSKDYLNILWKTNIVSAYHKTIANRYVPFP